MKKNYQELCLTIIQIELDVITLSAIIADDSKDFNKGWLDD